MTNQRSKTAMILTGGGIMGAAYEIGCLAAFDRLFCPGFSSRRFDTYIGISAGSVIATLVANRIDPGGLFKTIARNEMTVFNWRRRDIYRFDWWAVIRSLASLPRNLLLVRQHYRKNNWQFGLGDLPHLLHEQFPAGLFSLEPLQSYLCNSFRNEGICDDFSRLGCELFIPAYDLDFGERIVFGTAQHQDLHICQAITASSAIPFFFQPHRIGENAYIDGSTGQVTHIDIAIENGARLIVLINPRVPFRNDQEITCLPSLSYGKCSQIDELGILFTWEQAKRIECREKLILALDYYRQTNPEVDILLFEPGSDEALLFFQGPMSIAARNQVMHYGYHLTLSEMKSNYRELSRIFAGHGIQTTAKNLDKAPPE
ncbi:MAG: patatin-like phospholipase family protein [Desulfuromonadales bacterium]|nr:patatin-like phospholipase family protein [Desulfuromonadales bacterium]